MPKLRRYIKRLVNTIRAAYIFGPSAAIRLVACGPGMSVTTTGKSQIVLQSRVTFGRECGIAVMTANDSEPARLTIGDKTSFESGLSLNCQVGIEIGSNCVISWDVCILDTDFHQIIYNGGREPVKCAPIKIGDRVWIGARVTILKGVNIGEDSVVAAGSVVTKAFPPKSLIAGNPAKLIKPIDGWRM